MHEFVRRRLQRVDGIDLADDIVQEVFLIGYRLMTRLTYPQPGNNLCGLLIGVARNLVLQAARARHRWALPLDDGVVGAARELAVDDALLVADVRCKVLVLIREQTEFSRALLHALYVDQRSMRAVARDLHASESNVRLLAHRAVTRITRDLHRKFCTELSP
ncbi:sigma-70 family RNA polymerase sigma factor, partial [Caldilinea sp.]|uniref:RNA polymerase sigma factor n=1 Tax=Caldilinea sp. TaxID=2293560 RepID=UPI002C8C90AF|nr:sigma-70 family RNA polymerase sigma factor [Caldilinea sp.]